MEEALFKVLSFITFIMLGYLLRRLSILKAETFRVLSGIVFYITLPCIIITSINGVPVTSEMLWLVALGALCNVLMVATGYGMTHGKARQERAFSMLNLSGYNIGTFAMPFVAGFLPPTGFLATCLFDAWNAIMCTGGTYALANSVTDASQHLSIKSFLRNVFSSIPFCIYLIMIVMAFLHLALPHPVLIFTKIAGDANAFLCMLMIGVNINLQMDSKSFRCLIKHINPASCTKHPTPRKSKTAALEVDEQDGHGDGAQEDGQGTDVARHDHVALELHGEDEGQRRGGGEGDDGHSLPDFKREGQITVEEERQHG